MEIHSLSQQDTRVIKGMAICAMLIHHLYCYPGFPMANDSIIPYTGVLKWLGELGKVCVSLFLFCSGYGMAKQYLAIKGFRQTIKFVLKRLIKFYTNYWFVFIIFVPIGIIVFSIPLSATDSSLIDSSGQFFLDFLGLRGFKSYNVTWWFNLAIILLYIVFPILFLLVCRLGIVAVIVGTLILRFGSHFPVNIIDLYIWQFPFLLGIFWVRIESSTRIKIVRDYLVDHKVFYSLASILFLCMTVFFRMNPIIPHWSGVSMDAFISCGVTLVVISSIRFLPNICQGLSFLGKHSANIYLTHTFLNGYWNPEWLHVHHWMRCGINFLILMSICLLISIIMEELKNRIGSCSITRRLVSSL